MKFTITADNFEEMIDDLEDVISTLQELKDKLEMITTEANSGEEMEQYALEAEEFLEDEVWLPGWLSDR